MVAFIPIGGVPNTSGTSEKQNLGASGSQISSRRLTEADDDYAGKTAAFNALVDLSQAVFLIWVSREVQLACKKIDAFIMVLSSYPNLSRG
ncbi:hypothetical protein BDW60DRAFT_208190 [Aspergillus nidulans var. acristatus]